MSNKCILNIFKIHIIIILLFLIGFLLRIYDLGVQSFWLDEAISSNAAVALLKSGSPTFPSGILYDRSILNTLLITLSFKIFGVNEFAARFPSVLFGTLTILLVYLIGSKWGNQRIGIIAAFLIAFSVWEIAWSRQARMYQQLQFFYILSLYVFYEFTVNLKLKWFLLLAFSTAGTILSHEFGYVLIPVFATYLVIMAFKKQFKPKTFISSYFLKLILIFAALLGFAYYRGIISLVMSTDINYYDKYIYLLKKDMGIFLFLAVPGGTVLVNKDMKKGLLLIAALIIPLYFIFFHVLLFGTRYLYFVIPILFILIAFFLDFVADVLKRFLPVTNDFLGKFSYIRRLREYQIPYISFFRCISGKYIANVIVSLLLISAMYFSPGFTFSPKEQYDLGVNAPLSDFKKAYSYVKDSMQPDDVIVSAWTPPTLFYLGKSDFWLAFDVVGTGMDSFMLSNSSREVYTNAIAIKDVNALENITQAYGRGWIIVDNLAWYKLNPEMKGFIESNTDKKLHDATIRVYMWNNSMNGSNQMTGKGS